jgi:hypothetical protein
MLDAGYWMLDLRCHPVPSKIPFSGHLREESIKNKNLWIPTFVGMTLDREFSHSLVSAG